MGLLKGKTIPIEVFGSVKAAKPLLSEFPKLIMFGGEVKTSKSLLMQYYKKAAYSCSKRFWKQTINRSFEPTYAMQCGTLYELLAIGENVHGGAIDMELFKKTVTIDDLDSPIYYKRDGKYGKAGDLQGYEKIRVVEFTTDYNHIKSRADYFKKWFAETYPTDEYEITTQFSLEYGNLRGTCDLKIVNRTTGWTALVDKKYTGLVGFDLPYSRNDYELNPESKWFFPNRYNGIMDAKMYSLLYRLIYGKAPDAFIYFLTDSNMAMPHEKAIHAIDTTLSDDQIARVSHQVYDTIEKMNSEEPCAAPSMQDCFDCPARDCLDKMTRAAIVKAKVDF
jgi:hypothetical protein